MSETTQAATHALVLTPMGRDAAIAQALLGEAGIATRVCGDLTAFVQALGDDVSFALVTEETMHAEGCRAVGAWIGAQPNWSDLPFIVLTRRGGGLERNPPAARLSDLLGNATFLERPFHPTTLVSMARTALRGRQRQFEARARLAELNENEQRLRTALVAGRLGSWELDVATGTLWCSETCRAVFGRAPRDPFDYGDLLASIHPADKPAMEAAVRRTIDTGEDYAVEYRNHWPDGRVRWAEVRARLVTDGQGRRRLVGVSSDITDRKTAEGDLRRLNETLEERVAARTGELERAHAMMMAQIGQREQAEDQLRQAQKMEAIGQLTGGVAHDFNNLLTVIRSSADLLRRQNLTDDRRRRYIDAIADTADRAAKLTRQLLAFARRQALKPEVFDAAQHVNAIADMLLTVLGARITLSIESRCEEAFIEADAGQFETAIVNMAVNARDAMDGEGRLTVTIARTSHVPALRGHTGTDGDFIAVSVTDTGSGIPAADLGRIFEPFFTTKGVGKGTGLGLSQVFGFTKQSGGEIDVESTVGQGTTFRLFMPRVPAPVAADAPPTQVMQTNGRGRVLVVEDNVQVGEFATQLLTDLGYETTLAPNAVAALEVLEATAGGFDVVFSDVVMPGIGGVELGHRIRVRWPGLPVMLTSGYSHVLAEEGRHGFALLQKPYSVEDLSRALRQATNH